MILKFAISRIVIDITFKHLFPTFFFVKTFFTDDKYHLPQPPLKQYSVYGNVLFENMFTIHLTLPRVDKLSKKSIDFKGTDNHSQIGNFTNLLLPMLNVFFSMFLFGQYVHILSSDIL